MTGALSELERLIGGESLRVNEMRVSGICSIAATAEDRDRRAGALTHLLLEAAGDSDVRLIYQASADSRVEMRVSVDNEYPMSWSRIESVLQRDRGFVFDKVTASRESAVAASTAIRPPAVLVGIKSRRNIGFGFRPPAEPARSAWLSLIPWLRPGGIEDALPLVATAGKDFVLEFTFRQRVIEPADHELLQALADACRRGSLGVFGSEGWTRPTAELQEQIGVTLQAWLTGGPGVAAYVGASGIRQSERSALQRALFAETDRSWPSSPEAACTVAGRTTLDLRASAPLGVAWSRLVPSSPSNLKLLGPTSIAPILSRLPVAGSKIGTVSAGTHTVDVRIQPRDRDRHVYCVGSTGVGKSTLLTNLIVEDVLAGDGVCVIDPHGDLTRQVLNAIPRSRSNDVVWLQPGLEGRTFGLNLLESHPGRTGSTPSVLANELIRIFSRLYDMQLAGGPMFEQYMRSAALLVMENRRVGGTLLDIVRLFEDEAFRRELLKTCTDAMVVEFWTKTAHRATHDASLSSIAPYIVSKLNSFTCNAAVRAIVGQRGSTVDFRAAMDERAIVLLDLSVGALGVGDVQLLGMIALGRLFSAALGRVAEQRLRAFPMRVYVDEAQLFATETLGEAMAQSRKGGLSFTLANQNLAQFNTAKDGRRLLESIISNVSTFLAFRVGPFDAEILSPLYGPALTRTDLERLPDHHVACRLLVDGVPLDSFVCQTAAPVLTSGGARADIQARMPAYTRLVAEVESEIASTRTQE